MKMEMQQIYSNRISGQENISWPLIYFALSLIFLFSDILKMNIKNEFYESSNNYENRRLL